MDLVYILLSDDDRHRIWQYPKLDGVCFGLVDRAHEEMDQHQAQRAHLQTLSLHALLHRRLVYTCHAGKSCSDFFELFFPPFDRSNFVTEWSLY